jgi:hypothetical protein
MTRGNVSDLHFPGASRSIVASRATTNSTLSQIAYLRWMNRLTTVAYQRKLEAALVPLRFWVGTHAGR